MSAYGVLQRSMNPLVSFWHLASIVTSCLPSPGFKCISHIFVSCLFPVAFSCGIHCMAFLSNLWTGLWNIIFASQSTLQQAATHKKVIVVHCTCIILKEEKYCLFSKPSLFCSTGKMTMNAFSVFLEIKRLILSPPKERRSILLSFPMRDACRQMICIFILWCIIYLLDRNDLVRFLAAENERKSERREWYKKNLLGNKACCSSVLIIWNWLTQLRRFT